MQRIVLTFGFIAGAILSAMMLLTIPFMDEIGFDKGALIGYTTMVLAFLMVFFGVKSYRDNVAGGRVTFGRAFAVGILITVVASCCYVATWQFVQRQFTPDFADRYAAYAIERARASGKSDAEVAALTQQMTTFRENYRKPWFNIAMTFVEPLPVGLLFTIVTAGVMSRKRRTEIPAAA